MTDILFDEAHFGVPLGDYAEGIVSDVHSQGDVRLGNGGIDEMVMMAGDEEASADALRHPLLVEHQAVVVGDAQIEERRLT